MIENGFVHLPKEAAWLAEYLHELTAFPKGKHDDQVDSTAQMLDWFKSATRERGGFYGYYRALAEEVSELQTVKPAALSASPFRHDTKADHRLSTPARSGPGKRI